MRHVLDKIDTQSIKLQIAILSTCGMDLFLNIFTLVAFTQSVDNLFHSVICDNEYLLTLLCPHVLLPSSSLAKIFLSKSESDFSNC